MSVPARHLLLTLAIAVAMVATRRALAQGMPPAPGSVDDAVCFGFAFGSWSPPLDWRAAGHGDRPDSARLAHAPGGRDWAGASSPSDTVLMLYPAWWPVGVMVEIPTRRVVSGDTVTGRASALVADGRLRPPTATVRAWRVPCGSARAAAPPAPRAPAPDTSRVPRADRADSSGAGGRVPPDDSVALARRRPRRLPTRPKA